MKEDLETVKSLARDLRENKESPRSPREKLGGYALATRALDKCRAVLVGCQGEYVSNCPLDQRWLKFAELGYNAFRSVVATEHRGTISWTGTNDEFSKGKYSTREELAQMHHKAHAECFIGQSVRLEVRCEPIFEALN